MTAQSPEQDEYNYYDEFWRCGRADRCGLSAGWGTEHKGVGACKKHGGNGGAPTGPDNGNYKHGAFSEHLRSDLTDAELDAIDDMVDAYNDPEEARALIGEQAAEAWLKYKRSGDTRFLREYRQLAETFNLAPNTDEMNLNVDAEHTVDSPADFVTYTPDDEGDEEDGSDD